MICVHFSKERRRRGRWSSVVRWYWFRDFQMLGEFPGRKLCVSKNCPLAPVIGDHGTLFGGSIHSPGDLRDHRESVKKKKKKRYDGQFIASRNIDSFSFKKKRCLWSVISLFTRNPPNKQSGSRNLISYDTKVPITTTNYLSKLQHRRYQQLLGPFLDLFQVKFVES